MWPGWRVRAGFMLRRPEESAVGTDAEVQLCEVLGKQAESGAEWVVGQRLDKVGKRLALIHVRSQLINVAEVELGTLEHGKIRYLRRSHGIAEVVPGIAPWTFPWPGEVRNDGRLVRIGKAVMEVRTVQSLQVETRSGTTRRSRGRSYLQLEPLPNLLFSPITRLWIDESSGRVCGLRRWRRQL